MPILGSYGTIKMAIMEALPVHEHSEPLAEPNNMDPM